MALFNAVGKLEYERVINYFKVPKINLKEYTDITHKFSDVFDFSNQAFNENIIYDIKKSSKRKLEILSNIDIENKS